MDDHEYQIERSRLMTERARLRYEALEKRADRQYRLWFTGIIGTVVAILGLGIPAIVKLTNIYLANEIAETKAIGDYINNGIDRDINNRIRFADYFSHLIASHDRQVLWSSYLNDLKKLRDEGQHRRIELMLKNSASLPPSDKLAVEFELQNLEAMLGVAPRVNITTDVAMPVVEAKCGSVDFNNFVGKALPITDGELKDIATSYGVDVPAIQAFAEVEGGSAAFQANGQPSILFERNYFSGKTNGQFDVTNPDISSPKFGGYLGGTKEYGRLLQAMALDCAAALQATSWGKFQIMGRSYAQAGFDSVENYVLATMESEKSQFDAAMRFLSKAGLIDHLRKHDWDSLAIQYNGGAFANTYRQKLQDAYSKYSQGTQPQSERGP
jgi:hypothetical protein